MADASDNNPLREFLISLIAVVLFAAMVGFIGVSAWIKPAMDDKYKNLDEPGKAAATLASTASK